jgi:hypothetical protein
VPPICAVHALLTAEPTLVGDPEPPGVDGLVGGEGELGAGGAETVRAAALALERCAVSPE